MSATVVDVSGFDAFGLLQREIAMNKHWVILGFLVLGLSACVEDTGGKDGMNGIDGMNGDAGPQGEPGEDGTNGRDGTDGEDGQNGTDGTNGTDGVDGQDGRDGEDGTDGTDGTDGRDGTDGQDGRDGTTTIVICGDHECDTQNGENVSNCAIDCASTPAPFCGDNSCNNGETHATCSADCDAPPVDPQAPYCGDASCNNGETPSSCPDDCGTCGDGSCNNGEDHLLCPDDCEAPVVTETYAGPFKMYRERLTDGSYLCSIGVNPNYASGAANNQIVGEGASFLSNWESGSSSQILAYQNGGIESDGYVRFELPRDSQPIGTSTIRFSYRGWNPQSHKYEYAQYGDADTQLARMTDESLSMVYCFQYDPSKSSYGCSGRMTYEVFANPNTNKKDCRLTAAGNAQVANDLVVSN